MQSNKYFHLKKSVKLWSETEVGIPALSLMDCVTMGKFSNISELPVTVMK